ncbi:MAG: pilus assembly protein TadG-related protein [Pirellulales bacterium]
MTRAARAKRPKPALRRARRPGTVLLWVTVFLFALLALAALVVDGGLAMITRRQLQTAANVAALEGARRPAAMKDVEHRDAVVHLIQQLYDEEYGAGPTWEYEGGIAVPGTDYRAGPRIRPSSLESFRPDLSPNASNAQSGDLVRGTYKRAVANHREGDDYARADFTPADDGAAFLARVRRTGETVAGDAGTAGPRLPYLFGRTPGGKNPDWYDERARGMAIRGTAIADLAPVVSVGPAYSGSMYRHLGEFANNQDLVGLAPWAVRLGKQLDEWNGGDVKIKVGTLSFASNVRLIGTTRLSVDVDDDDDTLVVASADGFPDATRVPFVVRIDDELLTVTAVSGGTTWTATRAARGTQAAEHATDAIVTRVERLTIGTLLDPAEPLDWQSSPAVLKPADGEGIVALFATDDAFGNRIVGFGRASWITVNDELKFTPLDPTAASNTNATAHFPGRLPPGITRSNVDELLKANRDVIHGLRAPVFVRATE